MESKGSNMPRKGSTSKIYCCHWCKYFLVLVLATGMTLFLLITCRRCKLRARNKSKCDGLHCQFHDFVSYSSNDAALWKISEYSLKKSKIQRFICASTIETLFLVRVSMVTSWQPLRAVPCASSCCLIHTSGVIGVLMSFLSPTTEW